MDFMQTFGFTVILIRFLYGFHAWKLPDI